MEENRFYSTLSQNIELKKCSGARPRLRLRHARSLARRSAQQGRSTPVALLLAARTNTTSQRCQDRRIDFIFDGNVLEMSPQLENWNVCAFYYGLILTESFAYWKPNKYRYCFFMWLCSSAGISFIVVLPVLCVCDAALCKLTGWTSPEGNDAAT